MVASEPTTPDRSRRKVARPEATRPATTTTKSHSDAIAGLAIRVGGIAHAAEWAMRSARTAPSPA